MPLPARMRASPPRSFDATRTARSPSVSGTTLNVACGRSFPDQCASPSGPRTIAGDGGHSLVPSRMAFAGTLSVADERGGTRISRLSRAPANGDGRAAA